MVNLQTHWCSNRKSMRVQRYQTEPTIPLSLTPRTKLPSFSFHCCIVLLVRQNVYYLRERLHTRTIREDRKSKMTPSALYKKLQICSKQFSSKSKSLNFTSNKYFKGCYLEPRSQQLLFQSHCYIQLYHQLLGLNLEQVITAH